MLFIPCFDLKRQIKLVLIHAGGGTTNFCRNFEAV